MWAEIYVSADPELLAPRDGLVPSFLYCIDSDAQGGGRDSLIPIHQPGTTCSPGTATVEIPGTIVVRRGATDDVDVLLQMTVPVGTFPPGGGVCRRCGEGDAGTIPPRGYECIATRVGASIFIPRESRGRRFWAHASAATRSIEIVDVADLDGGLDAAPPARECR